MLGVTPRARRRLGFTLVELVIAIGVIAVLMSILLPTIGRVRYQARKLQCSSNLRSIAAACNDYAAQWRGSYPSFDMPESLGNLIGVSQQMYRTLTKSGIPHDGLFCPVSEFPDVQQEYYAKYAPVYSLGYHIWIPRKNGTNVAFGSEPIMPPPLGANSYGFPVPVPTKEFQGPARAGDPKLQDNPIVTDVVRSGYFGGVPLPADADPSVPNPYNIEYVYGHQRERGVITDLNAAWGDGHVETVPGPLVRPRYIGSWWHWR